MSLYDVLAADAPKDSELSPIELRAMKDAEMVTKKSEDSDGSEKKQDDEEIEEPKAKPKPKPKPVESEEVDQKPKPKPKARPEPRPKLKVAAEPKKKAAVAKTPPQKRKKVDEGDDAESGEDSSPEEPVRHPPGYSLLKAERDRIERALIALQRKASARQSATGSKRPPTTVCSILTHDLIEFLKDERRKFNERFGRYLAEDDD